MSSLYPKGEPTREQVASEAAKYAPLVPDPHDLFAECGTLAGAVYGNQFFIYIRATKRGTEMVVTASGKVIFHAERDCITDERLVPEPSFVGRWAWGLGLKRIGFRLSERKTISSGIDWLGRWVFTYA